MSVVADMVEEMVAAGATPEVIRIAVQYVGALEAQDSERRTKEKARCARYYNKNAERLRKKALDRFHWLKRLPSGESEVKVGESAGESASRAVPSTRPVSKGEALRASSLGYPQSSTEPSVPPTTAPGGADDVAARGRRIAENWKPNDSHRQRAQALGLNAEQLDGVAEEFRNYWRAESGQRARKIDWDLTFTNRLNDQAGRVMRLASGGGAHGRGNGKSLIDATDRLIARADRAERGAPVCETTVQLLPVIRG